MNRIMMNRAVPTGCAALALCLVVMWGGCCALAAPASPDALLDTVTSAIAIEKAAHERGSEWEREQALLQEELRQARLEEAWYALQVNTFTRYVDTARSRVDELTKTRDELVRMETELEGSLVESVEALENFVRQDMPFLQQERDQRLRFLHASMDDYELGGAEKLRRVLEALQAELGYGRGVELAAAQIDVQGVSRRVQLLRTGRAGLYALSPDGSAAWRWTRAAGFVPVEDVYLDSLREAAEMTESGSAFSLPVLPFGEVW
ncbi:DUF3450 domain-containing protein [Oleidesulfovibrio alaskensis]